MVISIAKHDVKCHSAIEFSEILPYICASLKDKVYNIQITIACAAASSIIKAKQ